jgi:hypothetical protein
MPVNMPLVEFFTIFNAALHFGAFMPEPVF